MNRRYVIALLVLSIAAVAWLAGAHAASQSGSNAPQKNQKNSQTITQTSTQLDAKTIRMGLRTTWVEDQGFIERVVVMSQEGKLPGSMIDSTFDWARKKQRHQFQYFKSALTVQAEQIGVDLTKCPAKDAAVTNGAGNSTTGTPSASDKAKSALRGLLMPLRFREKTS